MSGNESMATSPLQALRAATREWLERNVPDDWRAQATGMSTSNYLSFQRDWLQKLAAAGLATSHWTQEWPGGGRSLDEQIIIAEEMARADAPRLMLYFISLYHAAVTLMKWGSERQKRRHLPAILEGEVWCQGFSEPNAGSDLASLRTKADRLGDHYIVSGQKTWSTMAQHADFCLLLARTDVTKVKQAGITFLLMDMKSPGIVVRPIRQITGEQEFAEIFLDDVRIPVANRLGEENGGWLVAQTTLTSERGMTILELSERLFRARWRILAAIGAVGAGTEDDQFRRETVDLFVRIDALRALVGEMMATVMAGQDASGCASIVKLLYSQVLREFTELGQRVGAASAHINEPFTMAGGQETGNWSFDLMNSYQWTIAAGSSEIQRNIIAERVLGMPRDKSPGP